MQIQYTPEEVAAMLKVTRRTIYNWISEGRIKAVKLGYVWRISETSLNDFLQKSPDKE
jgi:excisionase family DNA binding protein